MPTISLQGELGAFGVDDVLALVASRGGALRLDDGDRRVTVWLDAGDVVGADDGASTDVVDVLAGLLRWSSGTFAFAEGDRTAEPAPPAPLAGALQAARAVLADWLEVESVVPSPRVVLSLAREAPGVDVGLAPSEWVAVAAIGSGAVASDAAAAVGGSLLFGLQVIKGLAERGLVEVGAEASTAQATAPSRSEAKAKAGAAEPSAERARPASATAVDVPIPSAASEGRRHLLGEGNGPLAPAGTAPDERQLPALHSVEPFAEVSSSVESLARVLDSVNDTGADGEGADDERVALLRELEALREGLRAQAPPSPSPAPPDEAPAPAGRTADSRRGRRSG